MQDRYEKPLPQNLLYESFKCDDATRSLWGNIVVVKSDTSGQVCDVVERDMFFIERLVYRQVNSTIDTISPLTCPRTRQLF